MRRLLWCLALVGLAACRREPAEAALRLEIGFRGYHPGCIRILAEDAADPSRTKDELLDITGTEREGVRLVAVYRQAAWSDRLKITAEAHEFGCGSNVVARATATATLPDRGVEPVPLDVSATDADEDGYVTASAELPGTDCRDDLASVHPDAPEVCDGLDNDCDGMEDEGFDASTYYADQDSDGFGAPDASVRACQPPVGYLSNAGDCDDRSAYVHSKDGGEAYCDGVDDDCSGRIDDAFDIGTPCSLPPDCEGTKVCANPDGGSRATVCSNLPTVWYVDEDQDGQGKAGPFLTCRGPDAGLTDNDLDCNDGDPFTFRGAPELCDFRDNDCNGIRDDPGTCPPDAGLQQVAVPSGATLESASAWGRGQLWIAGDGGTLLRRDPTMGPGFEEHTGRCPGDWLGAWASASGDVYLAGRGGQLAFLGSGPACTGVTVPVPEDLSGIVGFDRSPRPILFAVGSQGRTYSWDPAGSPTPLLGPDGGTSLQATLHDIHGTGPDNLLAVGGLGGPRVYRYNGQRWRDENVHLLMGVPSSGSARGVWMVHRSLAFVVGDSGLFLKWDGTSWTVMPKPGGGGSQPDLISVLAFGSASVYAVSSDRRIRYFDGTAWQPPIVVSNPLFDLAGKSPDDLWFVGAGGYVLHWYE